MRALSVLTEAAVELEEAAVVEALEDLVRAVHDVERTLSRSRPAGRQVS
jgi:hypothetical protein